MNFFDVINMRRSVRKFTSESVPSEVIEKALSAALKAPNSSNMQPWEFYWIKNDKIKKNIVDACFGQMGAKTAPEIIISVARTDTWKRNLKLMKEQVTHLESTHPRLAKNLKMYYGKLVPLTYTQGFCSTIGYLKKVVYFFIGLFRPVPRYPNSLTELREVLVKSTALACQNFILSVVAQGYGCLTMEGFDETRIKKAIKLKGKGRVVMVLGIGRPAEHGVYGPQIRFDRNLFIKTVE